jgi:hypothetical protein
MLQLSTLNGRVRESHIRVANYYGDVWVHKSEADFKADYRVNREKFLMLCQLLSSSSEFQTMHPGGQPTTDVAKALAAMH